MCLALFINRPWITLYCIYFLLCVSFCLPHCLHFNSFYSPVVTINTRSIIIWSCYWMYKCTCDYVCHWIRCACHDKHTSIDIRLCMWNRTFKHFESVQPAARMLYIIVFTNLFLLFFFLFFVQFSDTSCWNNESRRHRLFSVGRQITLTASDRYFYKESHDDIFSFYTQNMVKWATERTWTRFR